MASRGGGRGGHRGGRRGNHRRRPPPKVQQGTGSQAFLNVPYSQLKSLVTVVKSAILFFC